MAYRHWAEETGENPVAEKVFGEGMVEKYAWKKEAGGNVYLGIGLAESRSLDGGMYKSWRHFPKTVSSIPCGDFSIPPPGSWWRSEFLRRETKNVARFKTSLDVKEEWMRNRHAPASASLPLAAASGFAQRHYSVAEIATLWSLSSDAVRKLFQDEPGVLVIGGQGSPHKRRYTTLRVPESVLQRVHRRMTII
jgi:hypothetical protein